jgi:hypothetical protein
LIRVNAKPLQLGSVARIGSEPAHRQASLFPRPRLKSVFFYLYLAGVPVPVLGLSFVITPEINGLRSIGHFILFLVFFYLGFIRK